jgi:hypothetical protein
MTEPTDRSIPAVSSTKTMPTAAMPMKLACLTMLDRLGREELGREEPEDEHDGRQHQHRARPGGEVERGLGRQPRHAASPWAGSGGRRWR